jgi:hypothetical protein
MVVVILGMHRSGTSLTAGLCQKLGVNMGAAFRVGDQSNPDGYFEDLDWRALNKWLLNAAGGTWYDPPSRAEIARQASRIEDVLRAFVLWKSRVSVWGFKDPRTCLTIHAIHKYLIDPYYVIVRRPENEIVDSLIRRSKIREYSEPRRHWVALTEQYMARMERFLENCEPRSIEIQYKDLVSGRESAKEQLTYLAGFLKLPAANVDMAMELIRFRQ